MSEKIWSEAETDLLVDYYYTNIPTEEIASRLGRTYAAIRCRIRKLKIKRPGADKPWSDEEVGFIRKNYIEMTCSEIAERLEGRTTRAVQHKFNQLGLKRPEPKIGNKFGRLTIISEKFYIDCGSQQKGKVKVRCECGTEKEVLVVALKSGKTVSCGCWKAEKARERMEKTKTHGMSNHPLYKQYNGMIARCKYPSMKHYKNYGGRGITVCEERASSFVAFAKWAMENGWTPGITIERKDNAGNYEPTNCRFATYKEQANNKRGNVIVSAFGESKTLSGWADDPRCVVSWRALRDRIQKLGWEAELAIATPIGRYPHN